MTHDDDGALVGRDEELGSIDARFDALVNGRGGVVVVEGEPGAGKSAFVDVVSRRARDRGFEVLGARAWPLSSAVPYEAVVAALSRWLRGLDPNRRAALTDGLAVLGSLVAGVEPDTSALQRTASAFRVRVHDAIATLLARAASEAPVLLVVDDLHWADQASLEVLGYLAGEVDEAGLLLVLTSRPVDSIDRPEVAQFRRALSRGPTRQVLRLGRLTHADIARVLAGRLGAPVTERLVALVDRRSAGMALAVVELTDALVERGAVAFELGRWHLVHTDIGRPTSAHELIEDRLSPLEPDERAVLEVLGVADGPTSLGVVQEVVGPGIEVRRAADALLVRKLAGPFSETGEIWSLRHPLIAQVVDAGLSPGDRRRLHGALLSAQPEAPIGRRAHHAMAAAELLPRDDLLSLLMDAGTEALGRGAPAAAIEPLRCAQRLMDERDAPALHHRVDRDLGTAHARQLEVGPALLALRRAWARAQDRSDVEAMVELLRPLDEVEFRAGHVGVDPEMLTRLRGLIAGQGRWDLLVELGWIHLHHAGRASSVIELHRAAEAIALVPTAFMPPKGAVLAELVADYPLMYGPATRPCGAWVDHLLALADRAAPWWDVRHRALLCALDHAAQSGDPDLMDQVLSRLRTLERDTGQPPSWRGPVVQALRSVAEGDLLVSLADLRMFGEVARSRVLEALAASMARRVIDGPECARVAFDDVVARTEGLQSDRPAVLYAAFGRLLVSLGGDDEQVSAVAAAAVVGGAPLLASGPGVVLGSGPAIARALADSEDVEALAELDRAGAGQWLPSAWASLVRARSATGEAAAGHLLEAARIARALGRDLEAAERVIDAAERWPSAVTDDELASAEALCRRAGARWLATRAAQQASTRPRLTVVVPEEAIALTRRELEVVAHVAAGLTNREIAAALYVSIRTVTSHLDHVYTKLALASRPALIDWYRRLMSAQ